MYVAVKGGETAIENAHAWLAEERRGATDIDELSIAQIREQLGLAVNRVMAEGSLYDPDLAALAIKQSRGDLIEAIFLIRAYRTTLPRFGYSNPVKTDEMACDRRISATFKDAPGGQVLGPTFDYTHRLLDFKLDAEGEVPAAPTAQPRTEATPHITEFLKGEDIIQDEPASDTTPGDLTREPMEFPSNRPLRLQSLTRGDEVFVLGMAYSTQRGYARNHAFVGELRIGKVAVEMDIPELGFAIDIGETRGGAVDEFLATGNVDCVATDCTANRHSSDQPKTFSDRPVGSNAISACCQSDVSRICQNQTVVDPCCSDIGGRCADLCNQSPAFQWLVGRRGWWSS